MDKLSFDRHLLDLAVSSGDAELVDTFRQLGEYVVSIEKENESLKEVIDEMRARKL